MSVGLELIRERMADYLRTHGVNATAAFPTGERLRLDGAVVVVSLRGCQAGPSGFQDYLGERYNSEAERWEELYGRKAALTFGLDLYAPPDAGEDALQSAFDSLALALTQGAPTGLEVREFSCGETGYDQSGRLLKRPAQAVCGAYLYAVTLPGGAFVDFEIRGDRV